jgi:hypothetical protein
MDMYLNIWLLNDTLNSLGQLIKIIRQPQMETVVDKLIDFSGGQDEELRDISGLGTRRTLSMCLVIKLTSTSAALKTITAELPPDGKVAASACAKLTPKLLGQIQDVCFLHLQCKYLADDILCSLKHHPRLWSKRCPSYQFSSAVSPLSYQTLPWHRSL